MDKTVKTIRRYVLEAILLGVFLIALMWGRALTLQRGHYESGESYLKDANYKLALREWDLALHFYTPMSPYNKKSANKLWAMGVMYELEGSERWALAAYSSIRSAFYASRSLYLPGKDWISKCDEKIADLSVKMLVEDGITSEKDFYSEKEKYMQALKADKAPAPLWSAVAGAGFVGWVLSVMAVIFRGFKNDGGINRRAFLLGAVSFLALFSLWGLALFKA